MSTTVVFRSSTIDEITESPMIILFQKDVAAVCILLVSAIGFIMNATVAIFTRKIPVMNNAFGCLLASQSTGEAILCAFFAFYFFPMVFFNIEWMKTNSAQAGWIILICYDICIWSHLFLSINRLVAICFPLRYELIFTPRCTRILIVFSWIIPIATAVVLYKITPCDFFYSPKYWAFIFTSSNICAFVSWNIDFYKDISIVIIIVIVDITTIFNVHYFSSKLPVDSKVQDIRRQRDVNFLKQVVLQGIVFVVELLTYFYFAWRMENRWGIWSLTTLAWNLVHTTDGLIIIAFNREFREMMIRPLKKFYFSTAQGLSTEQNNCIKSFVHPTQTAAIDEKSRH